jgi:hypothetical protein
MRRGLIEVSPDLLEAMFQQDNDVHYLVVKHGLPVDAQIVDVQFDRARNMLLFVIQSESYAPVAEDASVPRLPPIEFLLKERPGARERPS